ncbi:MAG: heparan-alpha-glucosaminide N-acetyltransferase domain-containing protein [bacterium]
MSKSPTPQTVSAPLPKMPKERIDSLDAFRGFTILGMIFVIMVAGYHHLPQTFPHLGSAPVSTWKHATEDTGEEAANDSWKDYDGPNKYERVTVTAVDKKSDSLITQNGRYTVQFIEEGAESPKIFNDVEVRHAKPSNVGDEIIGVFPKDGGAPHFQGRGNGCTFTDLIAPFFVFIVGVAIPLSRRRRGADWWKHVGARTLNIYFAGVIYISLIFGVSYWWGILQAIAVAYFMGAAFLLLPPTTRWIALALVCVFHAFMSMHFEWWLTLGDPTKPFFSIKNPTGDMLRPLTIHCTPWVSISYGVMTVIGTFLGEAIVSRDPRRVLRTCLLVGIACTAVGYLMHLFQAPINKDYVSPSYAIFTSGVGALCFLVFYWIIDVWKVKAWAWFLIVFGMNALLGYFLQPIVRIFMTALGLYQFLGGQSGWRGMGAGLAWTAILWCIVLFCNKRNIFWKL